MNGAAARRFVLTVGKGLVVVLLSLLPISFHTTTRLTSVTPLRAQTVDAASGIERARSVLSQSSMLFIKNVAQTDRTSCTSAVGSSARPSGSLYYVTKDKYAHEFVGRRDCQDYCRA